MRPASQRGIIRPGVHEKQRETAVKPGSVIPGRAEARLGSAAIPLDPELPPGLKPPTRKPRPSRPRCGVTHTPLAYLVLLRMEVAAFHPPALSYRRLVSVALFVTSPCQGVTLHPALRSPDFPPCGEPHSGCLADSRRDFTAASRA